MRTASGLCGDLCVGLWLSTSKWWACGCQPPSGGPGNTLCARHVVACSCVAVVSLFFHD